MHFQFDAGKACIMGENAKFPLKRGQKRDIQTFSKLSSVRRAEPAILAFIPKFMPPHKKSLDQAGWGQGRLWEFCDIVWNFVCGLILRLSFYRQQICKPWLFVDHKFIMWQFFAKVLGIMAYQSIKKKLKY